MLSAAATDHRTKGQTTACEEAEKANAYMFVTLFQSVTVQTSVNRHWTQITAVADENVIGSADI